ncbi:MAG: DAPG hydrolase family protein [Solirubrobacterales bacterium]
MSDPGLAPYLERPMTPADPATLAEIERGPADPAQTVALGEIDRLLDPAPLPVETGWCFRSDGTGYVAVRTPMPGVSAEMVEWWFDWHPRDPDRYRAWHPLAHTDNSIEPPATPGAKPHWGAVHHPVEDLGAGDVHVRIAFGPPTAIGFSTDALDDPAVATIVCGFVGDDTRHLRHSVMAHVFLAEGDGVVLRSHFWLGAAVRPHLPAPVAVPIGWAINNRLVRRLSLPRDLPRSLAAHCAEEYTNLAALVPELYRRFGPGG